MALGYNTYYEIPHLPTYADALRQYEDTKPIRGDENETRPCGRRSQPWFSIWRDPADKSIHVGYGRGEIRCRTLVRYHLSGEITVHKRGAYSSASCNERRERLLGTTFRTHQYDTWVKCAWYDEGVKRKGYLPLQSDKRGYTEVDTVSTFARSADGDLVYLNYKYPNTHKINKPNMKQLRDQMMPFMRFFEGIRKLQGVESPKFSDEVYAEYFGCMDPHPKWGSRNPIPNRPLRNLRWGNGEKAQEQRGEFFQWATSEDHDDWMRAALAVSWYGSEDSYGFITDIMLNYKPNELLVAEVHKEGKLVKDRYRRYLLA